MHLKVYSKMIIRLLFILSVIFYSSNSYAEDKYDYKNLEVTGKCGTFDYMGNEYKNACYKNSTTSICCLEGDQCYIAQGKKQTQCAPNVYRYRVDELYDLENLYRPLGKGKDDNFTVNCKKFNPNVYCEEGSICVQDKKNNNATRCAYRKDLQKVVDKKLYSLENSIMNVFSYDNDQIINPNDLMECSETLNDGEIECKGTSCPIQCQNGGEAKSYHCRKSVPEYFENIYYSQIALTYTRSYCDGENAQNKKECCPEGYELKTGYEACKSEKQEGNVNSCDVSVYDNLSDKEKEAVSCCVKKEEDYCISVDPCTLDEQCCGGVCMEMPGTPGVKHCSVPRREYGKNCKSDSECNGTKCIDNICSYVINADIHTQANSSTTINSDNLIIKDCKVSGPLANNKPKYVDNCNQNSCYICLYTDMTGSKKYDCSYHVDICDKRNEYFTQVDKIINCVNNGSNDEGCEEIRNEFKDKLRCYEELLKFGSSKLDDECLEIIKKVIDKEILLPTLTRIMCKYNDEGICDYDSKGTCAPVSDDYDISAMIPFSQVLNELGIESVDYDNIWSDIDVLTDYINKFKTNNNCTSLDIDTIDHSNPKYGLLLSKLAIKCFDDECCDGKVCNKGCLTCQMIGDVMNEINKEDCEKLQEYLDAKGDKKIQLRGNTVVSGVLPSIPNYTITVTRDGCSVDPISCEEWDGQLCLSYHGDVMSINETYNLKMSDDDSELDPELRADEVVCQTKDGTKKLLRCYAMNDFELSTWKVCDDKPKNPRKDYQHFNSSSSDISASSSSSLMSFK